MGVYRHNDDNQTLAEARIDFDLDRIGIDAVHSGGKDTGQHAVDSEQTGDTVKLASYPHRRSGVSEERCIPGDGRKQLMYRADPVFCIGLTRFLTRFSVGALALARLKVY